MKLDVEEEGAEKCGVGRSCWKGVGPGQCTKSFGLVLCRVDLFKYPGFEALCCLFVFPTFIHLLCGVALGLPGSLVSPEICGRILYLGFFMGCRQVEERENSKNVHGSPSQESQLPRN